MQRQDHDAQPDKTGVRNASYIRLVEFVPRHDGPDVYKGPDVEKQVNRGVYLVMSSFRFLKIFAIPVQGCAGGEAGEEVADPDAATGAEDKEADCGGE